MIATLFIIQVQFKAAVILDEHAKFSLDYVTWRKFLRFLRAPSIELDDLRTFT